MAYSISSVYQMKLDNYDFFCCIESFIRFEKGHNKKEKTEMDRVRDGWVKDETARHGAAG